MDRCVLENEPLAHDHHGLHLHHPVLPNRLREIMIYLMIALPVLGLAILFCLGATIVTFVRGLFKPHNQRKEPHVIPSNNDL